MGSLLKVGNYFTVGKVLGQGSFGKVYLGMEKNTRRNVAIKEIHLEQLSKNNPKLISHLENEIGIMKELNHPNIVCLLECKIIKQTVYLVLEYCSQGDLQKYLSQQPTGKLSEEKTKFFMKQLASGLEYLRSKDVIHRDLKPENLILTDGVSPDEPILKIADFGFARHIENNKLAETLCGSPLHMAPEILMNQPYTVKSDLWSVGTIMYQMLFGVPLFQCNSFAQLFQVVKSQPIVIPQTISPLAQNLLYCCLQRDPNIRISWEEFFAHPYFKDHVPASIPKILQPQNINYSPQPPALNVDNNNNHLAANNPNPGYNVKDDHQHKNIGDHQSNNSNNNNLPNYNQPIVNNNANVNNNNVGGGGQKNIPNNNVNNKNNNNNHGKKDNDILDGFVMVQKLSEREIAQKEVEIKKRIGHCVLLRKISEGYVDLQHAGKSLCINYKALQILQSLWKQFLEVIQYVENEVVLSSLLDSIEVIRKLYEAILMCTEQQQRSGVEPLGVSEEWIYETAIKYAKIGQIYESENKFGSSIECYITSCDILSILKFESNIEILDLYTNSLMNRVVELRSM